MKKTRICKRCGLPRPLFCFRETTRGLAARCVDCEALPPLKPDDRHRRYRVRHPDRATLQDRRGNLRKHNITPEQYDALVEKQNGCCAVCGHKVDPEKRGPPGVLCVDHDPSCCDKAGSCGKCIRGLACTPCNVAAAWVDQYGEEGIEQLRQYLAKPPIIFGLS